jgi:alpha,alpha-trehalase
MEHLLEAWPVIRESVGRSHILLMFDFDGTLAPIVKRPSAATLSTETRSLLRRLNEKDWCSIAIISGRALGSLSRKVRLEGLIYGGSHGARLSGPGIDFQVPFPDIKKNMKKIASRLGPLHSSVKGVIIENKGEAVAVHYRSVPEEEIPFLFDAVAKVVDPFLAAGMVKTREGKKVIDIIPYGWDKGKAVLWLLDYLRASRPEARDIFPVYVGDDTTDEDAFAAVRDTGLAVIVGARRRTQARYRLKNISEVRRFMIYLLVDGRLSAFPRYGTQGGASGEDFAPVAR